MKYFSHIHFSFNYVEQHILRCVFLSVISSVILDPLFAAQPNWRLQTLSIRDGLSQGSIYAIAQDRQGFLWFGTQDGLNRFDGYEFVIEKHQTGQQHTLSGNWINALAADPDGDLWVGSKQGLERRLSHSGRYQSLSTMIPPTFRTVQSLQLGERFLWVGTPAGLLRVDRKTNQVITLPLHHRGQAFSVRAIAGDDEQLWLGGEERGILHYETSNNELSSPPWLMQWPQLETVTVRTLMLDDEGSLWIGSDGHGVFRQDIPRKQGRHFLANTEQAESLAMSTVIALLQDRQRQIWIGGFDSGVAVCRLPCNTFERLSHDVNDAMGLPNATINSLLQDRGGQIWLGSDGSGVAQFNPRQIAFGRLSTRDSALRSDAVLSVLAMNDDVLWIGSSKGLHRVDRQRDQTTRFVHHARDDTGLSSDVVFALLHDHRGRLWVGTFGGLDRWEPEQQRFSHFRHEPTQLNSLSSNHISSLLEDRTHRIWVATQDAGINAFDVDQNRIQRFVHDPNDSNSLSANDIRALAQDRAGRLWIGSNGGGLDRWREGGDGFVHYRHDEANDNSLSNDHVRAIYEDANGQLWIGTNDGLNRFDETKNQFYHWREKDGLPNAVIYAIQPDNSGRLWLATNRGLSRFDPAYNRFDNFSERDGLQGDEFNGGASYRSARGELFFGGMQGLNAFFPQHIRRDEYAPPIVLTAITRFNRALRPNSADHPSPLTQPPEAAAALTLPWQDRVIGLRFAALHYADPARNRYAFRLEGFDNEWQYVEAHNRRATYTNLDPGDYIFRVKAANPDGVWNENGLTFKLTITPPFWQTDVFRAVLLLLVAAVLYGFYRLRLLQTRKAWLAQEVQLREREVQARTAEVVEQKQLIEAKNDALKKAYDEVVAGLRRLEEAHDQLKATRQQLQVHEKMAVLGTLTAGIAHEINNPINFLHLGSQNLSQELSEFRAFVAHVLSEDVESEIAQRFEDHFKHLDEFNALISNGAQRVQAVLKDLRVVSHMDSERRQHIAINDIVRTTLNLVKTQYKDRIVFRAELEAMPPLLGWPSQFGQVVMNLLVNACQAIESRVTDSENQRQGEIIVRCHTDSGDVVLECIDNGCGMDEATRMRLFEPFFTTKPQGVGTGLGLSISWSIIEKHGGRIDVSSRPGEGSCFVVRIPIEPTSS